MALDVHDPDMKRRQVLALALPALTGCLSSASTTSTETSVSTSSRTSTPAPTERTATPTYDESASESVLKTVEWIDTESKSIGFPYSAVRVRALVDDAPLAGWLRGRFDTGTTRSPSFPTDPERYRADHATDLYPAEDVESGVSGWIVFHPDDPDARLIEVVDSYSSRSWSRE